MLATVAKCLTVSLLLGGAPFLQYAGPYSLPFGIALCLLATFGAQRAVRRREYAWAAGCVAVAVAFSPLVLHWKLVLLVALTGIGTLVTVFATWRRRKIERV